MFLEAAAREMSVSCTDLQGALDLAFDNFKVIYIPKKNGAGCRRIVSASAELKLLQRWLHLRVIRCLPVSGISTAFLPRASIVANAKRHCHSAYSVRVDVKDFFPSISFEDLDVTIMSSKHALPSFAKGDDVAEVMRKACFDANGFMPIGYVTSPGIANAVMRSIDESITQELKNNPELFGRQFSFTRYADDFVFSSDLKGACARAVGLIRQLCVLPSGRRLRINDSKTRFMNRAGGSTLVTGLRVHPNGKVGVHGNYRDHVRLLLKHYSSGILELDDAVALRGHLAFLKSADPERYTRLCYRYFEAVARIERGEFNIKASASLKAA